MIVTSLSEMKANCASVGPRAWAHSIVVHRQCVTSLYCPPMLVSPLRLIAVARRAARSLDQAISYEFLPPASLYRRNRRLSGDLLGGWRIVACPTGEPDDFMKVANRAAFWDLGLTMMQRIARHMHIEVPKDTKLFGLVYTIIQETLGCSDAEALDFCTTRPLGRNAMHVLWQRLRSISSVVDLDASRKCGIR